jgi:hypothetical protein
MPNAEAKTITIPLDLYNAMDALLDKLRAVTVLALDKPLGDDEVATIKIDRHTRLAIRTLDEDYTDTLSGGAEVSEGESAIDIARKACGE